MDKKKFLCSIVRTLQISDNPESWIDKPSGMPSPMFVIPKISGTPSNVAIAGFYCTWDACHGALSGNLDLQSFVEPGDSTAFENGFNYANGPMLRIGIAELCSGSDAKLKNAVRFVDTQDCIPDNAFVGEPGISPVGGTENGHRTWFPIESEQNRMAASFQSGDSAFGIEVGWVVTRFAAALLVALSRAGFVPRDWKWAKQRLFDSIHLDI